MFDQLKEQPQDKILALMGLYRDDPRKDKVDLGVGVYKDASGDTPIFEAVKIAEKRLWETEETKSYTGLIGDAAFHNSMADLILDGAVEADRLSFAHTPGGTGAVHQVLELVKSVGSAKIWVSDPTWPNHLSILKHLDLPTQNYRYFDPETRGVNFTGLMEDLQGLAAGDVVLLHGCCHNPTGANMAMPQWEELTALLIAKRAIPFIDIAYQGFGDGLAQDGAATQYLAKNLPQMIIAASCSKNFGIYRERAGLVIAIAPDAKLSKITQGNLAHLNRQNFSFPPDHGARLVSMILTDATLRNSWETELEAMRLNMLKSREGLASALREMSGSDRFGFLAEHRGMFSRIGATPEQVKRLRDEHAIYMVGDSRLNIAGVTQSAVPKLAEAFVAVGI